MEDPRVDERLLTVVPVEAAPVRVLPGGPCAADDDLRLGRLVQVPVRGTRLVRTLHALHGGVLTPAARRLLSITDARTTT